MRISLIIMTIGFSVSTMGQDVIDRTEQKAKDKSNQRVEDTIDETLDDGLDALENLFKRKKKKNKKSEETSSTPPPPPPPVPAEPAQEEQEEDAVESSGGFDLSAFMQPAKYESSYDFDMKVVTEIVTTDKKGKQERMEMEFLNGGEDVTAMKIKELDGKNQSSLIILDYKNESMVTVMNEDGEEQAIALPMIDAYKGTDESYDEMVAENMEDFTIEKTGRTKDILGYRCEEYRFDSKETSGTMWMSTETGLSTIDLMGNLMKGNKQMERSEFAFMTEGMVMESESTDKKRGEVSTYKVTALEKNADITINMGDYKMMGAGR